MENPWNFKTGDLNELDLATRPVSQWRRWLGFVSVMVIDAAAPATVKEYPNGSSVEWKITKTHYEWKWMPFGKYPNVRGQLRRWFKIYSPSKLARGDE